MPFILRRALISLTAVVLATLIAGCTGVQLGYRGADFLILREAGNYLDLERAQKTAWSPTLKASLARHRDEELPYLAAFFDRALAGAERGFTQADLTCLLNQAEALYQRHFRLAAAATAPLLTALSARQVDALAVRFAEEATEDANEAASGTSAEAVSHRLRKRAERYESNLDWWVGELDSRQRGIIRDVARRIPDTAPAWYAWRDAKRRELIALLRTGAAEAQVEAFLTDWLVDYRDLPPSLADARDGLHDGMSALLLRLDPTFSHAQRDRLTGRLEGLRRDFLALQQTPRQVPVGC